MKLYSHQEMMINDHRRIKSSEDAMLQSFKCQNILIKLNRVSNQFVYFLNRGGCGGQTALVNYCAKSITWQ